MPRSSRGLSSAERRSGSGTLEVAAHVPGPCGSKLAKMEGWIVWLVVACGFGAGEMLMLGFYLAPFAIGAALAARCRCRL